MRLILRHLFSYTLGLYIVDTISNGLVFENGIYTFFVTAGVLTAVSFLGKPIINLLLLPLNLITFGLFRWVSSAIAIYIVTLIVKDFKVIGFVYYGFTSKWFDLPVLNLNGFWAYIVISFVISIVTSFIDWLHK